MHTLANEISAAFHASVPPTPVDDCTGGVYYLRAKTRRIVAVFKPSDEEPYTLNNPKRFVRSPTSASLPSHPEDSDAIKTSRAAVFATGIRTGISPGDAAVREVAAYLIDKRLGGAGVPVTVLATASHGAFHYAALDQARNTNAPLQDKTGALQVYVPHKCTADDVSSSLFSDADVHAIAVLDIRLANQDRHGGNVLVVERAKREYKLVPIDHGACLPRVTSLDETSLLWLFWPQAKRPFANDVLARIASLDAWEDVAMLRQALPPPHTLEREAVLTLHVCTALLQVCALERHMSAYDVGMLMCRHASLRQQQPVLSVLERLVGRSLDDVAELQSAEWSTTTHDDGLRQQEQHEREFIAALTSAFKRHLRAWLERKWQAKQE